MTPTSDGLIAMAQKAEASLKASASGDLDALEAALDQALEAARHFRVQIDLAGRTDVSRMIAFEALFRSAIEVQPRLGAIELDGAVEALTTQTPAPAPVERAGAVRASAFVVARALLDTLNAGYRVGFGTEAKR